MRNVNNNINIAHNVNNKTIFAVYMCVRARVYMHTYTCESNKSMLETEERCK